MVIHAWDQMVEWTGAEDLGLLVNAEQMELKLSPLAMLNVQLLCKPLINILIIVTDAEYLEEPS